MTKNSKITSKTAATKQQPQKSKKKYDNRRGGPKMYMDRMIGKSAHSQALAMLIANPCDAMVDNLPGVTGETVIRRVRTIVPIHAAGATNTGYLLWYPEYHGFASNGQGENANFFLWEVNAGSESQRPTNTTTNPLGSDTTTLADVAGDFLPDPASSLVYSETTPFASACTLAACMKYCYSGSLSLNSGFVYPVEDLPVTTFFNQAGGLTGTANGASSFANLQSYAKTRARIPLEGIEVVWRPKRYNFRGSGETLNTIGFSGTATDTLFQQGVPSVVTRTTLQALDASDISGFGIAWNGLDATKTSDVFIECIKVVELQLRPTAGFVEERPATVPSASALETAKSMLDEVSPNWQVRLADFASHTAAKVTVNALAGTSAIMRAPSNRISRLTHF